MPFNLSVADSKIGDTSIGLGFLLIVCLRLHILRLLNSSVSSVWSYCGVCAHFRFGGGGVVVDVLHIACVLAGEVLSVKVECVI